MHQEGDGQEDWLTSHLRAAADWESQGECDGAGAETDPDRAENSCNPPSTHTLHPQQWKLCPPGFNAAAEILRSQSFQLTDFQLWL